VHDGRCHSHHAQRHQCPLRLGAEAGSERSGGTQRDPRHQRIRGEQLGLLDDLPVRQDDRAGAAGDGDHHAPAVLDRPHPAHRLLLVGLVGEATKEKKYNSLR